MVRLSMPGCRDLPVLEEVFNLGAAQMLTGEIPWP